MARHAFSGIPTMGEIYDVAGAGNMDRTFFVYPASKGRLPTKAARGGNAMTRIQTPAQLRRLNDLSTIHRVVAQPRPTNSAGIGLTEVADALRMRVRVAAARDSHAARDTLLTIACEWDLQRDRLDTQSDVCLAVIARFLRAP
jgi:hypothetical protein